VVFSVGILILGALNIEQKREYQVPGDGASWIKGASGGIEATKLDLDGPAARAGIQEGDILIAINGQQIETDWQVTKVLWDLGMWFEASYLLQRGGAKFNAIVTLSPPSLQFVLRRLSLEIVGIFYFLAGAFVLIKRFNAPHVLRFYFVCLISFVLLAFSYTGKLNAFDWTIFWLETAATVFLPPLFLHFCLEFPVRRDFVQKHRRLVLALYAPGTVLFLAWCGFVAGILTSITSPLAQRVALDTISDVHFGVYFLLSAAVLVWTYRTARAPGLRQQMKWVTRGTALAVVPYFLLQSLPRAAGFFPGMLADVAIFPLALIPTAFGYAIHRYRLMDVDIIFKRGVTYTLATASVATLILLASEVLGSGLEPVGTGVRVGLLIVAALLFTPIKDQFQVWFDKLFYRERYSIRRTLVDFGRTLGSEVRSENMLDRIVDRLSQAFFVDRAAIFVESTSTPETFVPAFVTGVDMPMNPDLSFLKGWTQRPYIFLEEEACGLNYFIPCRVKDRVIAYIGLGRTQQGDYLTSEDLELLEAMSDYVGIALENARLYRSLEEKVAEYHELKDFNENIIESIHVGVVVEDVAGRVAGANKALETMTGLSRSEILNKRTDEVVPLHFLQRLSDHGYLHKQQWNGLTVNFSLTSFVDKTATTHGRLIIIDDITDRVRLEDQLIENEKLTSIGLLAAGVAHEVNTPLAVISSYSQMLQKQIGPDDPGYRLLEKITGQTFRASEIVNSLLSFSRTNASEFSEVDVHEVIRETLSLLEHPLKTARVRLRCDLLAETPVTMGNSGKLQQVFLNLFLNARDAMVSGGELQIRTCMVDSRIEIVVSDTGIGISKDNIKKIYDPFFTTKTAGKGTGLGLSVSYGIVREHGGNISVESNLGRGTSFRLDFPCVRKAVNV
jgi:PAS domain S-box-containing protein